MSHFTWRRKLNALAILYPLLAFGVLPYPTWLAIWWVFLLLLLSFLRIALINQLQCIGALLASSPSSKLDSEAAAYFSPGETLVSTLRKLSFC